MNVVGMMAECEETMEDKCDCHGGGGGGGGKDDSTITL
jgi:hypothetical protein